MNLSPKISVKFNCDTCHYKCSKKSEWIKHTMTRKHINRTNNNDLEQINLQKSPINFFVNIVIINVIKKVNMTNICLLGNIKSYKILHIIIQKM